MLLKLGFQSHLLGVGTEFGFNWADVLFGAVIWGALHVSGVADAIGQSQALFY